MVNGLEVGGAGVEGVGKGGAGGGVLVNELEVQSSSQLINNINVSRLNSQIN